MNRRDDLTRQERNDLKRKGLTKDSRHTKSRDKLSGKSKRAMKRAEKRGDITRKEGRDAKRCVEDGDCRRAKKNRCSNRQRRNGNCPYPELFAGVDDSEDIELMEDYFERYDEEELEFIANFLLGADDEDDEEDDSEDYYYY